jgi:succinate dehydrogenase hydrophobic anchor subunit
MLLPETKKMASGITLKFYNLAVIAVIFTDKRGKMVNLLVLLHSNYMDVITLHVLTINYWT